jgi:hypothetical protein
MFGFKKLKKAISNAFDYTARVITRTTEAVFSLAEKVVFTTFDYAERVTSTLLYPFLPQRMKEKYPRRSNYIPVPIQEKPPPFSPAPAISEPPPPPLPPPDIGKQIFNLQFGRCVVSPFQGFIGENQALVGGPSDPDRLSQRWSMKGKNICTIQTVSHPILYIGTGVNPKAGDWLRLTNEETKWFVADSKSPGAVVIYKPDLLLAWHLHSSNEGTAITVEPLNLDTRNQQWQFE